jgi:hypothetical protein
MTEVRIDKAKEKPVKKYVFEQIAKVAEDGFRNETQKFCN